MAAVFEGMREAVVRASPAAHDTVSARGLDLPLELDADALALPLNASELLCLDRVELGADSLDGGAVSGNALRLTEELVVDHLLRLVVRHLVEPPLMLAVQLEDLVLRLVGQILLEVADMIALLDTVLRGNMCERCVHDCFACGVVLRFYFFSLPISVAVFTFNFFKGGVSAV